MKRNGLFLVVMLVLGLACLGCRGIEAPTASACEQKLAKKVVRQLEPTRVDGYLIWQANMVSDNQEWDELLEVKLQKDEEDSPLVIVHFHENGYETDFQVYDAKTEFKILWVTDNKEGKTEKDGAIDEFVLGDRHHQQYLPPMRFKKNEKGKWECLRNCDKLPEWRNLDSQVQEAQRVFDAYVPICRSERSKLKQRLTEASVQIADLSKL